MSIWSPVDPPLTGLIARTVGAAIVTFVVACLVSACGSTVIQSNPAAVAPSASPTISGAPVTAVQAGQGYTFSPTAASPRGAPLVFSISYTPTWASFNTSTGQLAGTPAITDIGTFANISIAVTDGTATASLAAFTITVRAGTTGSAALSWTVPTTRTDGTPLTTLAGFRIYYGSAAGNYPNTISVPNPGITTYVVDNLSNGTYYFVATAYDTNGLESDYSPPGSKTIQ
jgi:putative Ig domain-containing protein